MTQIDWSKAPEGATHFLPEQLSRGWVECWYKNVDGTWFGRNNCDRDWYPDRDYQDVFIPLLIARQAQWLGEGLPPVGTKVTIETCGLRIWEEAEMFVGPVVEVVSTFKLTNSDMVVVYLEDENACCVFRASMCRMPKTPAQLAAEEREERLIAMSHAYQDATGCSPDPYIKEAFRALDAEGYRKVEVKP